jgi:hypothetical protein
MSLWFFTLCSSLTDCWRDHPAVGDLAAAGVYYRAAVFAAAMTAKIAPPDVIFGGFAFIGFLAGIQRFCARYCHSQDGLADRAARALSARLTDSWPLMVGSVVLLSYALAFVMPSNMGRIALLMPIVAAMAKRAGIEDGTRAGTAWRWRWGSAPSSFLRPFCPPTSLIW